MKPESPNLFRAEVLEDQPNRLHGHVVLQLSLATRMLVVALVATIAIAAVWVANGEYARNQTVRGILVTSSPSVKIYPQRPGIVEQFDLVEGQFVNEGDILAVINTDIVSERGMATADAAARAAEQRLALALASVSRSQRSVSAQASQLQQQIASLTRQIARLEEQVALQTEIVASHRDMFASVEAVVDRGFVSRVDYERRRQNLLSSEQSLSRMVQDQDRLESQLATAEAELARLDLVANQERSDIESLIAQLEYERAQSSGERSHVIRAPIAGRVSAVQTAQGRQANGQTPMLVILPDGAELYASLYAPSAAIGMVQPGQPTSLLIDAFPYQTFGSVEGRVSAISSTVLDPRDADVPFQLEEPVYQIQVALDAQSINAFGNEVPFQSGMTLTANIMLEKQTFLDWLLTPLRAVLNRS